MLKYVLPLSLCASALSLSWAADSKNSKRPKIYKYHLSSDEVLEVPVPPAPQSQKKEIWNLKTVQSLKDIQTQLNGMAESYREEMNEKFPHVFDEDYNTQVKTVFGDLFNDLYVALLLEIDKLTQAYIAIEDDRSRLIELMNCTHSVLSASRTLFSKIAVEKIARVYEDAKRKKIMNPLACLKGKKLEDVSSKLQREGVAVYEKLEKQYPFIFTDEYVSLTNQIHIENKGDLYDDLFDQEITKLSPIPDDPNDPFKPLYEAFSCIMAYRYQYHVLCMELAVRNAEKYYHKYKSEAEELAVKLSMIVGGSDSLHEREINQYKANLRTQIERNVELSRKIKELENNIVFLKTVVSPHLENELIKEEEQKKAQKKKQGAGKTQTRKLQKALDKEKSSSQKLKKEHVVLLKNLNTSTQEIAELKNNLTKMQGLKDQVDQRNQMFQMVETKLRNTEAEKKQQEETFKKERAEHQQALQKILREKETRTKEFLAHETLIKTQRGQIQKLSEDQRKTENENSKLKESLAASERARLALEEKIKSIEEEKRVMPPTIIHHNVALADEERQNFLIQIEQLKGQSWVTLQKYAQQEQTIASLNQLIATQNQSITALQSAKYELFTKAGHPDVVFVEPPFQQGDEHHTSFSLSKKQ